MLEDMDEFKIPRYSSCGPDVQGDEWGKSRCSTTRIAYLFGVHFVSKDTKDTEHMLSLNTSLLRSPSEAFEYNTKIQFLQAITPSSVAYISSTVGTGRILRKHLM